VIDGVRDVSGVDVDFLGTYYYSRPSTITAVERDPAQHHGEVRAAFAVRKRSRVRAVR